MKKLLTVLIFAALFLSCSDQEHLETTTLADVGEKALKNATQSIDLPFEGALPLFLSESEYPRIQNLTITGFMNQDDFDVLAQLPALTTLDLSGATIVGANYMGRTMADAIPDSLFHSHTKIQSVIFPPSTKYIGKGAFAWCKTLTSAPLPASLTMLGESAFFFTGITEIDIPPALRTIGKYAYSNSNLLNVYIPSTVFKVFEQAFAYNYNIETIEIAGADINILEGCFAGQKNNFKSLILNEGLKVIPKYFINSMQYAGNNVQITLPNSVEVIRASAFHSIALSQDSLYLPDNLKELHSTAFNATDRFLNAIFLRNPENLTLVENFLHIMPYHNTEGDFYYKNIILHVPPGKGAGLDTHPVFSKFGAIVEDYID